jgi:hypothetical protein
MQIARHDESTGIISEYEVEVPELTTFEDFKALVQQHDKTRSLEAKV